MSTCVSALTRVTMLGAVLSALSAVVVANDQTPAFASSPAAAPCTDARHGHLRSAFGARTWDGIPGVHRQSALAPLAARYRVTVTEPSPTGPGITRQQEWTFVREPNRIAISKGNIEEIWRRLPNGSVNLQRVFHDEQRVIDYPAGELISLGIEPDWTELSTFMDPREYDQVEWDATVQLPARLTLPLPRGAMARYELLEWKTEPATDWALAGVRGADYLQIDAADFGDMAYDPAVRKAEALDVRAGWRNVHRH